MKRTGFVRNRPHKAGYLSSMRVEYKIPVKIGHHTHSLVGSLETGVMSFPKSIEDPE